MSMILGRVCKLLFNSLSIFKVKLDEMFVSRDSRPSLYPKTSTAVNIRMEVVSRFATTNLGQVLPVVAGGGIHGRAPVVTVGTEYIFQLKKDTL